jgi:threonine synthase
MHEPFRVYGKKTISLEIHKQLGDKWPEWIVCPTGSGALAVGVWLGIEEINADTGGRRPHIVAAQIERCCPIVESASRKASPCRRDLEWVAAGLVVEAPHGAALIKRALQDTQGVAVAVEERIVYEDALGVCMADGAGLCSEAIVGAYAVRQLRTNGVIGSTDGVVLVNTAGPWRDLWSLAHMDEA